MKRTPTKQERIKAIVQAVADSFGLATQESLDELERAVLAGWDAARTGSK